jgi:tetratricopeptide (TPR) repeat protein
MNQPAVSSKQFSRLFLLPAACLLIASFAQAANKCSEEARYMISGAAECLEHDDPGCAKLKLDPVLEKEPNCSDALFIRGWITQYHDGKVEEGRAMQEKALELDPKLGDFWEERAHAIESHLTSQSFSHFDLEFYGAEDRDKAWDAVKYLNEMYADLGSFFGASPPARIPVIVFTAEEFLDAWRAPFIGGFFDKRDGKIRLRVDDMPKADEEFRHRARHELTHAFVYQLYPHDLPSWASEGFAEFCARQGTGEFWKENRLEEIRKLCRNSDWLTLRQIQEAISKKRVSVLVIQQAYLESEALVLWVAKERGESWVPHSITYLHDHGGTFDDAFVAVVGITPNTAMEELHHAWE